MYDESRKRELHIANRAAWSDPFFVVAYLARVSPMSSSYSLFSTCSDHHWIAQSNAKGFFVIEVLGRFLSTSGVCSFSGTYVHSKSYLDDDTVRRRHAAV